MDADGNVVKQKRIPKRGTRKIKMPTGGRHIR